MELISPRNEQCFQLYLYQTNVHNDYFDWTSATELAATILTSSGLRWEAKVKSQI